MRVLFTVFASPTHVYNLVPLAWALRAAGHEVFVAGQPGVVDVATMSGLPAVAVGDQETGGSWRDGGAWNQVALSRGLSAPHEEQLLRGWDHVLGEVTMGCGVRYESLADQSFADDLVKTACAWEPDLIIWDALTFPGPIAAYASGAAHARLLFGLDYTYRLYQDYVRLRDQQPPERRDDPLTDWFTGRLARIGRRYEPDMATELLTGQWSIDPAPAWMRLPTTLPTVSVRALSSPGPVVIPDWVHTPPTKPRVCLTFGLTMREVFGDTGVSTGDLLRELADLDIELVATLDTSLLDMSTIPDNVTIVDFIPLNELLPTCSAMVHHAGAGTRNLAITHGVPSVVIPHPFWDGPECGRMFEARGIGLYLPLEEFTPATLKAKLVSVLDDPSFRAGAKEAQRDLLAAPTPHSVVPTLEELTNRYRRRL
ncbi:activator-dependent family glycosyltransferase [Nonomuraea sp. NPDC048826]|uniref:activator-dependent family glycosyltransferase n=1 Tax=Nonomuraea sp. NPDC048826 TaxID=3364347 RepID=UPI0037206E43